MTLFELVKQNICVPDAAEHYELQVNRNGMCLCPFHEDRHPSMKLNERYFYCFGCGATGDVIDLVARLTVTLAGKRGVESYGQKSTLRHHLSIQARSLLLHCTEGTANGDGSQLSLCILRFIDICCQGDTVTVVECYFAVLYFAVLWESLVPFLCQNQFFFHVTTFNLVYNAAIMVEAGIGYAITIDKIANTSESSNLCFRPLEPQLDSGLNVIWKKYQVFSSAAGLFLEKLRESFGN